MTGGHLLAYAPWQARDALGRGLVPVALFLVMAGIPIGLLADAAGWPALRTPGGAQEQALLVYRQTLGLAMTLGALTVVSGVLSLDRDRGHVRFLFSAPVVAWRFYLQRFLVGVALFAAALTLVPLAFGAVVRPVPVLAVTLSALLYAGLLGGLGMLAGALTRRDGAVVIAVALLASLLQPLAAAGQLPAWLELAAAALPPLHAADQLRGALLAAEAPDPGALVHVLGYSLGMLLTSLVIIHRAPLVR